MMRMMRIERDDEMIRVSVVKLIDENDVEICKYKESREIEMYVVREDEVIEIVESDERMNELIKLMMMRVVREVIEVDDDDHLERYVQMIQDSHDDMIVTFEHDDHFDTFVVNDHYEHDVAEYQDKF